jgi:hypothetical protein
MTAPCVRERSYLFNDAVSCYAVYLAQEVDQINVGVEHWWNDCDKETEGIQVKPVSVPLCLPQIRHRPIWD